MLTEENFLIYCMNHYENPHCSDLQEFEEDLRRVQTIRKLCKRYQTGGELKERIIMNNVIILFNVFGKKATNILLQQLKDHHSIILPFLKQLNYLPKLVSYNNKILDTDTIEPDKEVEARLLRRFEEE